MTASNFEYAVAGMTCGHCEKSVIEEVSAITGVIEVTASAADNKLVVTAASEIDRAAIQAAVEEAGYQLV